MSEFCDYDASSRYSAPVTSVFLNLTLDQFEQALNADEGEDTRKVWHEIAHFWLLSGTSFGYMSQVNRQWIQMARVMAMCRILKEGSIKLPIKDIEPEFNGNPFKMAKKYVVVADQLTGAKPVQSGETSASNFQLLNGYSPGQSPLLKLAVGAPGFELHATLGIRALVEGFAEAATRYLLNEKDRTKRQERLYSSRRENEFVNVDYILAEEYFGFELGDTISPNLRTIVFLELVRLALMIQSTDLTKIYNNPGYRFLMLLTAAKRIDGPKSIGQELSHYLDRVCELANLLSAKDCQEHWHDAVSENLAITRFNFNGFSGERVARTFLEMMEPELRHYWTSFQLLKEGRHALFRRVPPRLVHLTDILWHPGMEPEMGAYNPNPDHTAFLFYSICEQLGQQKFVECPYKRSQSSYPCGCDFEKTECSIPTKRMVDNVRCSFLETWSQLDFYKKTEMPFDF
jgi:hypothetical protein